MDLATILGILSAFGLVSYGILLGSPLSTFGDLPSAMIVLGGTAGATLIAYPLGDVLGIGGVLKNAFFVKLKSTDEVIRLLVEFSSKARRDGILALESATKDLDDQFLARGVQLAVDGQEPDAIESILQTEIDRVRSRHKKGADVLAAMGMFAPALGMIGTLIGLVQMLQNMSNPDTIGPAMAVALITTFYGAILANLVFNPLAKKLGGRSESEIEIKELTLQGILAIAAGDNPRVVEQRLHAFLRPKARKSQFD
ncbi:MAG: motility protein A [Candidatus Sumerlaeia bacterium]|nr:motility protein A [Candidatus Sumerlaeia bacterium]